MMFLSKALDELLGYCLEAFLEGCTLARRNDWQMLQANDISAKEQ